jgi:AcrR family transcriptional regulator
MSPNAARTPPEPAYRRAPEQKRQLLMAAARELFKANGYDETSTMEIAQHAGVSEGILFHHFGSKRGLFACLAEQYARDGAAATMPDDPDRVTEESVVRSAFAFAEQDPALYRLFVSEGPRLEGLDVSPTHEIVSVIEKNLVRAMKQGTIRRGDARVMAELQFAVVEGAYVAWRRSADPSRKEDYITEAVCCLKAMLASTPD